ncbi:Interleukin-10 [Galemys pyrenaicus]|uniref:Interleukin family protein n=1 Tax=Galemys pyrenaicus TaxID=202257 RepID=A0A8J6AG18_GALPY|nr:Interleukin-10 [Galemys pyrenaicus]
MPEVGDLSLKLTYREGLTEKASEAEHFQTLIAAVWLQRNEVLGCGVPTGCGLRSRCLSLSVPTGRLERGGRPRSKSESVLPATPGPQPSSDRHRSKGHPDLLESGVIIQGTCHSQSIGPARRSQTSTMLSSALLCCLVFLAGVAASPDHGTLSEHSCTHFSSEVLPHMLQELRSAFSMVKTFFVSMMPPQTKDQVYDMMLLNRSLGQDFKSPPLPAYLGCPQGYLGCQTLSEMIQFYLEEVMPQAENHGPDIKKHVNSLGEKLKTLRLRLRRCHRFLPCENKSKAVQQVKTAFSKSVSQKHVACVPTGADGLGSSPTRGTGLTGWEQRSLRMDRGEQTLQEKGIYKAMSEFEIFIDYIEDYMGSMKN